MSIFQHNPPFSRGSVLGATWVHPIEKTDPAVTGASQLLTKKVFTDVNPRNGAVLSNEIVTCVAVKNTTAAAVLPGTNQTVSGYVGVVDEYLPAAGCPVNEIYWLVIDGPTQQPLGTRVSLMKTGLPVPRLLVVDGDEVPENDDTNPAIRVTVGDEGATDGADSAATVVPAETAPVAPAVVDPVAPTTP
jgi:hypothetical protein